jgi:hypothetical protein
MSIKVLIASLMIISTTTRADVINGAFGVELGSIVNADRDEEFVTYFNPKNPLPGYEKYSFKTSPIGRRVVSITARQVNPKKCPDRDFKVALKLLESKYGGFSDNSFTATDFNFRSYAKRFNLKGRRISIICNDDDGGISSSLHYSDAAEVEKGYDEVGRYLSEKHNKIDL